MGYLPEIKPGFKERYEGLLGKDYDEFSKILYTRLRRSIRVNTIKVSVKDCIKRLEDKWNIAQIPWCKEGFFIDGKERKDIGNTVEHQMGFFYVQEAVSMIPAIVLDPKPGEIVLDMCAAPGSKTTQMAAMMENKGIIVANDYKGKRIASLGMNLQRCGVTNAVVSLMGGHNITSMQFDKILVDAPCSATGAIRKSLKVLDMWNPDGIKRLAGPQRQLIRTAYTLLKPKGTMVYSTCSLEPHENEAVIDYFLKEFPDAEIKKIDIKIKKREPILEFEGRVYNQKIKNCLRIWPQDNDTEGFFVAKIHKNI